MCILLDAPDVVVEVDTTHLFADDDDNGDDNDDDYDDDDDDNIDIFIPILISLLFCLVPYNHVQTSSSSSLKYTL